MTDQDSLASKPRILVVDDSRIVRATIRKHLSNDYDIIEEANGEAGWRHILADETIALLISDLSMPELDGLGLLRRIRENGSPRIRQLPAIIISGEEDDATKQHCVEAGANDFITKSTDRAEIQARVKASLDLSATRRELEESRSKQAQTATADTVTGAATSHLLSLQLAQALAFAQRHSSEVTLVLIEIDSFQPLAERLGERLSSQMLNLLAKLLSAKLRREDTFARLEGALFAIVSPGSSLASVRMLAERLRQAVSHARINFREEQLQVTGSFALANSLCDKADSAENLLGTALGRLRGVPGSNRLIMPDIISQPSPAPTLSQALALLHQGKKEEVIPHLDALLSGLLPLLELANEEKKLGCALEKLRASPERVDS